MGKIGGVNKKKVLIFYLPPFPSARKGATKLGLDRNYVAYRNSDNPLYKNVDVDVERCDKRHNFSRAMKNVEKTLFRMLLKNQGTNLLKNKILNVENKKLFYLFQLSKYCSECPQIGRLNPKRFRDLKEIAKKFNWDCDRCDTDYTFEGAEQEIDEWRLPDWKVQGSRLLKKLIPWFLPCSCFLCLSTSEDMPQCKDGYSCQLQNKLIDWPIKRMNQNHIVELSKLHITEIKNLKKEQLNPNYWKNIVAEVRKDIEVEVLLLRVLNFDPDSVWV